MQKNFLELAYDINSDEDFCDLERIDFSLVDINHTYDEYNNNELQYILNNQEDFININSTTLDYLIFNSDPKHLNSHRENILHSLFGVGSNILITDKQIEYLINNCDLNISDINGFSSFYYIFTVIPHYTYLQKNIEEIVNHFDLKNYDSAPTDLLYLIYLNKIKGINLKARQFNKLINYVINKSNIDNTDKFLKGLYLYSSEYGLDYIFEEIKDKNWLLDYLDKSKHKHFLLNSCVIKYQSLLEKNCIEKKIPLTLNSNKTMKI